MLVSLFMWIVILLFAHYSFPQYIPKKSKEALTAIDAILVELKKQQQQQNISNSSTETNTSKLNGAKVLVDPQP